ncbi:leptin receptor isoform X2 [Denticeps clupeoides]|uniref:leptin receptor-like isoform X2 n=1 Tax=Denticeps clupeoides TaxID=299321 RepID=UPI0010A38A2E|nr:leptin receptor-like isoform X2 [Denticeps clupeoides]XP_028857434.1 leptin receptor isoform X2 [Denticeps clupeoides]
MLTVLIPFIITAHGVASLGTSAETPIQYEDAPWAAELCCDLTSVGLGSGLGSSDLDSYHIKCHRSSLEPVSTHKDSSVVCLNILCWLDERQTNLICNRKTRSTPADMTITVSLQWWASVMDPQAHEGWSDWDYGHLCKEDGQTCSTGLRGGDANVSVVVNVTSGGRSAQSQRMFINTRQLNPPVGVKYITTVENEGILKWQAPMASSEPLHYQVRYSSSKLRGWKHLREINETWASLSDLSLNTVYTVQVRSQNLLFLDHWSNWSQPFYLCPDVYSYEPQVVFTNPGEEVTIRCTMHNARRNATSIRWWLNGQEPIPESRYTVMSESASAVSWRAERPGFDMLLCCDQGEKDHCSLTYAKVFTRGGFNAGITCQTTVDSTNTMTCKWNKSSWDVRFLYRRFDGPCESMSKELKGAIPEVECDRVEQMRKCTLRIVRLISCYELWLEVVGGQGEVCSLPVYITPIDVVKPFPPTDVLAVTRPNGSLRLEWSRPDLPAYALQYEVRYAAALERSSTPWQRLGPMLEPWAEVVITEPCAVYKVEVRCVRHNGSGYWSDWSDVHYSTISNSKAPDSGPDFWRVLHEDPLRNQTNVTLLFKPLPPEDPPNCAEGFRIQHQASGGAAWSNETDQVASYVFQWGQEDHTVTVMSRNAMGFSHKNINMTLTKPSKCRCVRAFSALVVNSTCVALSWTLLSDSPAPLSFVIEWSEESLDGELGGVAMSRPKWVRVQAFDRTAQLHDGEGEPVHCTVTRDDPAAYMLLMIIAFLSVVLFVTLIISQNQMKKLVWKDVPNPNNCSWAQGIDLRRVENIESLFRHPDGLTSCPLLLVSEIISEAEIITKSGPPVPEKEKENERIPRNLKLTQLIESDEALTVETSTKTQESSGQSSVMYTTVLQSDKARLSHKQEENQSSSSDEGNFSDISGSFTGGLWELENFTPSSRELDTHRSYNSMAEFSETSEHDDEALESRGLVKDLYYLGMGSQDEEDEDEVEEEHRDADDGDYDEGKESSGDEQDLNSRKEAQTRVEPPEEHNPLSARHSSRNSTSSSASQRAVPPYLPQFKAASSNPLRGRAGDSALTL